jgi:hypothetical protein
MASTTSPYTLLNTELDHQVPLIEEEHEQYETGEPQYDDYDRDIHLATTTEKKRLWWSTIFITGLFVASWYVLLPTFVNKGIDISLLGV